MIIINANNRVDSFPSFAEVMMFIRDDLSTKEEQEEMAEAALKQLKASDLDNDLIKYYQNVFNRYLSF